MIRIDATDMHYKVLNEKIRTAVAEGETEIVLDNICGQKFIGDGLKGGDVKIRINGTPGNDLAAFMDGPEICVTCNGQDGIGNTMNAGKVIINGHAGDVIGYAMRGGKILIRDGVGYRVGIHMKSYGSNIPYIVIGGGAENFFGEYMAGGIMVLLGLNKKDGEPITGDYVGTGMHGGVIYVRGDVEDHLLGREVKKTELDAHDVAKLGKLVGEYCTAFGADYDEIMKKPFVKLTPKSHRPYGNMYAH